MRYYMAQDIICLLFVGTQNGPHQMKPVNMTQTNEFRSSLANILFRFGLGVTFGPLHSHWSFQCHECLTWQFVFLVFGGGGGEFTVVANFSVFLKFLFMKSSWHVKKCSVPSKFIYPLLYCWLWLQKRRISCKEHHTYNGSQANP